MWCGGEVRHRVGQSGVDAAVSKNRIGAKWEQRHVWPLAGGGMNIAESMLVQTAAAGI